MSLKLIKASHKYKDLIIEMLEEWTKFNNENTNSIKSPRAIFKNSYEDFDYYLNNLDVKDNK